VPAAGSPTARRRQLGTMLRALRVARDMTTDQVAQELRVSRSKISRLENGRRGASKEDILRLCELYQVDEEDRLRFTELAAEGKQRAWWQPLSPQYSEYVGLESEAEAINDYGLAVVPGLLQTPDYARAILRSAVPPWAPKIVDERVKQRLARQQLLTSGSPRFEAVLDESVLHRIVGDPGVMIAQLERLLEMSELPNVTIRIVPYDVGAVPSPVNKFIILRFPLPEVADIVLIEALTGDDYLDEPEDVETYSATFYALMDLAANADVTRAMILAKLDAYQAQISYKRRLPNLATVLVRAEPGLDGKDQQIRVGRFCVPPGQLLTMMALAAS
jgi:transcriptional regulator with XRE-family HTH domain